MVIIYGRRYGEKPNYYDWDDEKKYPYFDIIEERKFELEDIEDIDEAELWLMVFYPKYYMGCSIINEEQRSFSLVAVPCEEYDHYMTEEARLYQVKEIMFNRFNKINS